MKGYILFQDFQNAEQLITEINTCLGLPQGETLTWQDGPLSFCSMGVTSGYTEFEAYAIKIDTDQCGQCLTQEQISSIINKPIDWNICSTQG